MRGEGDTQIKICGITRECELDWLIEEAVDYVGMVLFCPRSKRNLDRDRAARLVSYLKEKADDNFRFAGDGEAFKGKRPKTVAVMISPTEEQMCMAQQAGFDLLQIHGEMKDELLERAPLPVIRAVQVTGGEEIKEVVKETGRVVAGLYDATSPGSGKAFDWNSLAKLSETMQTQIFLAGGLKASNVAEAIRLIHPDVVDVSSSVEAPRYGSREFTGKDREKIRDFVRAVREAQK